MRKRGIHIGLIACSITLLFGYLSYSKYSGIKPGMSNFNKFWGEEQMGITFREKENCPLGGKMAKYGKRDGCHILQSTIVNYKIIHGSYLCINEVITHNATEYKTPEYIQGKIGVIADEVKRNNLFPYIEHGIILYICIALVGTMTAFVNKQGVVIWLVADLVAFFLFKLVVYTTLEQEFALQGFSHCLENGLNLKFYKTNKPFWLQTPGFVLLFLIAIAQGAATLLIVYLDTLKAKWIYRLYTYLSIIYCFVLLYTNYQAISMFKFSDQKRTIGIAYFGCMMSLVPFLINALIAFYYSNLVEQRFT